MKLGPVPHGRTPNRRREPLLTGKHAGYASPLLVAMSCARVI
jgi:hypothetical protein